ncbi:MAG: hypothetical protein ACOC1H_04385, partial [Desulfosalsimonas sp.]
GRRPLTPETGVRFPLGSPLDFAWLHRYYLLTLCGWISLVDIFFTQLQSKEFYLIVIISDEGKI